MITRPICNFRLARSRMRGVKDSSVEENADITYMMLALPGDTSMSAVFSVHVIE